MNWIIEHLPAWNSWIALLMYWLPLALCTYGYAVRTWLQYRKEVTQRDVKPENFWPELTIGTIAGRLLVAATPIANLFSGIFDVGPEVFGNFFAWCGRVFDIPLVPKRPK